MVVNFVKAVAVVQHHFRMTIGHDALFLVCALFGRGLEYPDATQIGGEGGGGWEFGVEDVCPAET